ncbi:MAG: hypothetical protein KDI13_02440 [Alphaproteobacteria bacterium]|nr:hypothetical protein [Alphaproteobacteria bacterium]
MNDAQFRIGMEGYYENLMGECENDKGKAAAQIDKLVKSSKNPDGILDQDGAKALKEALEKSSNAVEFAGNTMASKDKLKNLLLVDQQNQNEMASKLQGIGSLGLIFAFIAMLTGQGNFNLGELMNGNIVAANAQTKPAQPTQQAGGAQKPPTPSTTQPSAAPETPKTQDVVTPPSVVTVAAGNHDSDTAPHEFERSRTLAMSPEDTNKPAEFKLRPATPAMFTEDTNKPAEFKLRPATPAMFTEVEIERMNKGENPWRSIPGKSTVATPPSDSNPPGSKAAPVEKAPINYMNGVTVNIQPQGEPRIVFTDNAPDYAGELSGDSPSTKFSLCNLFSQHMYPHPEALSPRIPHDLAKVPATPAHVEDLSDEPAANIGTFKVRA